MQISNQFFLSMSQKKIKVCATELDTDTLSSNVQPTQYALLKESLGLYRGGGRVIVYVAWRSDYT